MPITFPYSVLKIASFRLDIVGQVISGGITQSGQQQVVNATGGGLWAMQLEFPRWKTANEIRAWRVAQYAQQGGVVPINVSICDLRQAPVPAGYVRGSGVPHSDGSPFADGSLYAGSDIVAAYLTDDAPLRATSMRMTFGEGSMPLGGEYFSLAYDDGYHEIHVITSVEPLGGDVYQIGFLTPLRAAHLAGETISFDHPTGTFRLAQQDGMSMATDRMRFGQGQAAFIEFIP